MVRFMWDTGRSRNGLRAGFIGIFLTGCAGGEWQVVAEDVDDGWFLSVWGASQQDVWVVGGEPDAGVVWRGAEDDWSSMDLPPDTPLLNWVHGTSETDVWLAGISGTLLHWDGTAWTDHSQPVEEAFWGVYARSTTEVYAVGGQSRFGGEEAVAYAFDGTDWTALPLPVEHDGLTSWFKVHDDGTDMWAIGARGAAMRESEEGWIAAPTGVSSDLVTANRGDSGPMVVVGGRGTGSVYLAESGALSTSTPAPAGLNGVQSYGEVAVVVGEAGYAGTYEIGTSSLIPANSPTDEILHATWGTPGGQMYAVGGNLGTADDNLTGVLLRAKAPEAP